LTLAATLLVISNNTIATDAFAQAGCANTFLLTIGKLPGQTHKADTQVDVR
jgi:hypothetical protein